MGSKNNNNNNNNNNNIFELSVEIVNSKDKKLKNTGPFCYCCLNNNFQCLTTLNVFSHTYFHTFFTHVYFQKIQTTLLEISY